MTLIAVIRRLRDEFTAMPGLRLRVDQVRRLCGASNATSASALRALVSAGFLQELQNGSHARADLATRAAAPAISDRAASPWHHILCLVEFENERHDALTAASYSALAYATALGVAHRARVTALHLVPALPEDDSNRRALVERVTEHVRRHALNQSVHRPIDVHVATGTSNEDVLRSARELQSDLIVLGQRDGGAAGLSQLRQMLREAPCHVLLVRPSGQAAVA